MNGKLTRLLAMAKRRVKKYDAYNINKNNNDSNDSFTYIV